MSLWPTVYGEVLAIPAVTQIRLPRKFLKGLQYPPYLGNWREWRAECDDEWRRVAETEIQK